MNLADRVAVVQAIDRLTCHMVLLANDQLTGPGPTEGIEKVLYLLAWRSWLACGPQVLKSVGLQ